MRRNCAECLEQDFPRPIYLEHLSIQQSQQGLLRQSKGCAHCEFTGNRGRVGLYELIEITPRLRSTILTGSEFEIREAARQAGLNSLTRQAVDLALAGELSVREAYRACNFA